MPYTLKTLLFTCILTAGLIYQSHAQNRSDLYKRVDSIVRYQLKFNVDSAMAAKKSQAQPAPATKSTGMPVSRSTRPAFPLIFLGNNAISMDELNKYRLKEIKGIEVVKADNPAITALYGSRAIYGVIFIYTKKYKGKRWSEVMSTSKKGKP